MMEVFGYPFLGRHPEMRFGRLGFKPLINVGVKMGVVQFLPEAGVFNRAVGSHPEADYLRWIFLVADFGNVCQRDIIFRFFFEDYYFCVFDCYFCHGGWGLSFLSTDYADLHR